MNGHRIRRVGFVGLGDQGGPMAVAIADAGFTLHAWARRPQSCDALSSVDFERSPDLPSLAGSVEMLALCLRDDYDISVSLNWLWIYARNQRSARLITRPEGESLID